MNDHAIRNRFSSLASLAAQAPHMYDLLYRVGLQRRRTRAARMARDAGWFGAGVAVGAGLGALLSQGNGQQIREKISTQARRVRDYVASSQEGQQEGSQQREPYREHASSV